MFDRLPNAPVSIYKAPSQLAFTFSKIAIEILEQDVFKYVQS